MYVHGNALRDITRCFNVQRDLKIDYRGKLNMMWMCVQKAIITQPQKSKLSVEMLHTQFCQYLRKYSRHAT